MDKQRLDEIAHLAASHGDGWHSLSNISAEEISELCTLARLALDYRRAIATAQELASKMI